MIRVLALYNNGQPTFHISRTLFDSVLLERKLGVVLKALLLLEAIAKLVIIPSGSWREKRMSLLPLFPLRPLTIKAVVSTAQLAENYSLCSASHSWPSSIFTLDWYAP